MNITTVGKTQCTGCSSCAQSCPSKAILMQEDEDGFYFPLVKTALCIECGKCSRFCPVINPERYKHVISNSDCFIVQSRDPQRKRSASGGAFITIASDVIRNGGVVFGASYDEANTVRHICVDTVKDLKKLQNSKYVQSDVGEIYRLVKEYLQNGKMAFFSGTPCQVAGLYAFLGQDDENLITADIICHGCPSPKLLKRQIEEESKTWRGKVKRVSFRYKNPIFKSSSSFYMMMMMQHGLPIVRRPSDDPYFNIFSKGFGFRESCYRCPFASPDRVGDFTLGDCDSHKLYKDFHPTESNSTVIINPPKARALWDKSVSKNVDYADLDINEEIRCNKQLGHPSERHKQRDDVYHDLENMTWDEFSRKYANKQSKIGKCRSYAALLMPNFIVSLWGRIHE